MIYFVTFLQMLDMCFSHDKLVDNVTPKYGVSVTVFSLSPFCTISNGSLQFRVPINIEHDLLTLTDIYISIN